MCGPLAFAGGPLAFAGGPLAFAGGPLAFAGGPLAFAGGPLAFAGGPLAFAGGPLPCWSTQRIPGWINTRWCMRRPTPGLGPIACQSDQQEHALLS